ncbi:hypothetical protein ACFU53_26540 [Streptomyces sp. NPDC057474]|uniref:hypothetical protein n=1 Tax=Streptomyces sp. NPDC057474 TaxID=3346144 RepID=UPI00367B77B2
MITVLVVLLVGAIGLVVAVTSYFMVRREGTSAVTALGTAAKAFVASVTLLVGVLGFAIMVQMFLDVRSSS